MTVEHNDTTGMIWWYHFAFQAYHKGTLFYPQPLKHAMTWIEGGGVSGLDRDTQIIQMISSNSNLEGSNSMIKQLLMHPIVLISIRFLFFSPFDLKRAFCEEPLSFRQHHVIN